MAVKKQYGKDQRATVSVSQEGRSAEKFLLQFIEWIAGEESLQTLPGQAQHLDVININVQQPQLIRLPKLIFFLDHKRI